MQKVIGFIADHPTPKIAASDGVAYTVNSRDYKGAMIVILSVPNVGRTWNGQHSDNFESMGFSRESSGG